MQKALTISDLSKESGLSRSALLYYDRLGLLRPLGRSQGNYRLYSGRQVEQLKRICFYRELGIPLKEIKILVNEEEPASHPKTILSRRLETLAEEIARLRKQQMCIVSLLKVEHFLSQEVFMMNKEKWTNIMKDAGLSEEDMRNWHISFEKMAPQSHQEFLESLGVSEKEIEEIRQWSRRG